MPDTLRRRYLLLAFAYYTPIFYDFHAALSYAFLMIFSLYTRMVRMLERIHIFRFLYFADVSSCHFRIFVISPSIILLLL